MTYYHRFFTLLTLKGSLFKMVHSIVGGHIAHTAFEKIASSLKIIVDEVLKVLNNNKKEPEHAVERSFIRETVTDFFASLLEEASQYLVKRYK
jgi:hypothetical protein